MEARMWLLDRNPLKPELRRIRLASTFNLEPFRRWYSDKFQHHQVSGVFCFRRQLVEWERRNERV